MHDPRPLEPDWATDTRPQPSGMVEWSTMRVVWNREIKKRESRTEYHEGTPLQFFKYIGTLLNSPSIDNAEITVDASQAILPYELTPLWYDTKGSIDDNYRIDWGLKYNIGNYDSDDEEVGTSASDLASWLAYVIENYGKCVVDIQDYDPTPQYMEIGSMF
jgi:hypothetical protein